MALVAREIIRSNQHHPLLSKGLLC
jgi:hypothetical protein